MAKKTTKKQPAKKSVGRPKFEITEEVMSEVKTLAGQGLTVEQIASCLGISPATFYNRQAENLEFLETVSVVILPPNKLTSARTPKSIGVL